MPSLSPSSNGQNAGGGTSPVNVETSNSKRSQGRPQPRPVDIFTLKTNGHISVLDCVFISKRSKRAVYATITRDAETTVWRAASTGTLTQIARIEWEHDMKINGTVGDGSLRSTTQTTKKVSMLTFDGKSMKIEDFLRKGRGWFSSDSKLFTMDDTEYKWKSGMDNAGTSDGQPVKNVNTPHQEAWKVWRCMVANHTSTSPITSSSSHRPAFQFPIVRDPAHAAAGVTPEAQTVSPSASGSASAHGHEHGRGSENGHGRPSISSPTSALSRSSYAEAILGQVAIASVAGASVPGKTPIAAPPAVLARFSPPQRGLADNEFAFYPALFASSSKSSSDLHVLEGLLVSAILLTVGKGEWKEVQSVVNAPALEAVFIAEAAGEVPPYTPRPAVRQSEHRADRSERPFTRIRSNSGPPARSRPADSPFSAIPVENSERTQVQRQGSLRVSHSHSRPSRRGNTRNASPVRGTAATTGTSVGDGIGMATNVGVGIGVGMSLSMGMSTSSRTTRAAGSHSAPPSQRHMRPSTADNHRPRDGFYAPRRPSLQVTTARVAPPVLSRDETAHPYGRGGDGRPSSDPANRAHRPDLADGTDTKEEFSGLPPAYA